MCTGNSARSQIAEGLILYEADERFEVFSAGTQPAPVRKEAVAVMQELGIDISMAGRSLAYLVLGILMVASLLTAQGVSLILQERMNQTLGPALILEIGPLAVAAALGKVVNSGNNALKRRPHPHRRKE